MNTIEAPDTGYADRVRASFGRQAFMDHLGAHLTCVEPGRCEVAATHRPQLTQQHGYFHGGVMASLADSAAGYAAYSLMPADATVLTVEYKLNILRPGQGQRLVARAQVVKPGRTLTVVQADVFAIDGDRETLCLTSLQTLMRLDGQPDDARRAERSAPPGTSGASSQA
ncbi:MAG TPA: PaaI family thioesterase [Vineibacter sp.]|nr:PaaI family thioesterase [Vineibacter sp.]